MDLSREPDIGTILYSLAKVERCKTYQAQKETIAADKEAEKEARRIRAEVNKQLKAQKAERKASWEVET